MKITDVQIDGFGVWSKLTLDDLSNRLTVFYGPNEAGKTTLLEFVRAMLYGIAPARRRYLPPLHGGRAGGTLWLELPAGRFSISRYPDPATLDNGQVMIRAEDGTVLDEPLLAGALQEIDEPTFSNVFAVGLRELQELGTLSDTDAATWLYRFTIGLDRVSLVDVLRELKTARDRIVAPDSSACEVARLCAERDQLRATLDTLPSMADRWYDIAQRRRDLEHRIGELEAERERLTRDAGILETAVQLSESWQRRNALQKQLAETPAGRELPAGGLERLQKLAARYRQRRAQRDRLRETYRKTRAEIKHFNAHASQVRQGPRIEALAEQLDWVTALEDRLRNHEQRVAGLTAQVTGSGTHVDCPDEGSPDRRSGVARRALPVLRRPARALRAAQRELATAQQRAAECRESVAAVAIEIGPLLADRSEQDLASALEEAGQLVSQLRQRVAVDERLDEMGRHQMDLDQQSRDLLEQQVLPVWVLVGLGMLFVLGVAMMLSALWFPASVLGTLGRTVAILGILGTATSGLIKFLLEHSIANRLDRCRRQIELLHQQAAEAKAQRDALDRQLPQGGGALTRRLQEAERNSQALERLLPLDTRRQEAQEAAILADQAVARARQQVDQARAAWRQALEDAGLPGDMTPARVVELARQNDKLAVLQTRLDSDRTELAERRREYERLTARIRRLATDLGMPVDDRSASDVLRAMVRWWEEEKPRLERRDQLRRRQQRLRRRVPRLTRAMNHLARQRAAILAAAGVSSQREYRQLALRQAQRQQLQHEQETLSQTIAAALGNQATEHDLARLYADSTGPALETRWEELAERLAQVEQQHAACLTERGALQQQEAALADTRGRAEKQLDLGVIEQRLQAALEDWQVRAAAWRILDDVRREYEAHRQPETLTEASRYLRDLTAQRYVKVWTPLHEDVLYVDDRDGQTLSVDILSRGTREQLFLSLRLALVSFYARRGSDLPLVLDDVFVNFDSQRTKAAARLLREFAKAGHQVLVFTCHEHVWKVFRSLRVDTRRLPSAGEAPAVGTVEAEAEVETETETETEVETVAAAVAAPAPEVPDVPPDHDRPPAADVPASAGVEVDGVDLPVVAPPAEGPSAEVADSWEEVADYDEVFPRRWGVAEMVDQVAPLELDPQPREAPVRQDNGQPPTARPDQLDDDQWVRVGALVRRRNMVAIPDQALSDQALAE